MEEKNEIRKLKSRINELENSMSLPYRCDVCGKPTDGYLRVLFWTHHYCRDHFPPLGISACTNI